MTTRNGDIPPKKSPGRRAIGNAQLLDAAIEIFLENGFERTSIDAIAAAAGMAKRTIYSRFANKDEIFVAALKRAIARWAIPAEELQPPPGEAFEETLLRIGRALTRNVLKPEGVRLLRIAIAESERLPEIGSIFYWQSNETVTSFLIALFGRELGGRMTQPDQASMAAHAYLHLIAGGPANSAALGLPLNPEIVDAFTRHCIRLFLTGVRHEAAREDEPGGDEEPGQRLLTPPTAPARDAGKDRDAGNDLEEENRRLRDLLVKYALRIEQLERLASHIS